PTAARVTVAVHLHRRVAADLELHRTARTPALVCIGHKASSFGNDLPRCPLACNTGSAAGGPAGGFRGAGPGRQPRLKNCCAMPQPLTRQPPGVEVGKGRRGCTHREHKVIALAPSTWNPSELQVVSRAQFQT